MNLNLDIKSSTKVIKPSDQMDMVFKSQGFSKKSNRTSQYYYLRIEDNCTRINYEVQIPIQEIYYKNKNQVYYKIQNLSIYIRSSIKRPRYIPNEIIHATNEKVHEALSYLNN